MISTNSNQSKSELVLSQPANHRMTVVRRFAAVIACSLLMIALALSLSGCGGNSIEGKYRVIEGSFGQAQAGTAVVFDGKNCNLYSPQDTYVYGNGDLTVTGLLGGNISFEVDFDGKKVTLTNSDTTLVLERM